MHLFGVQSLNCTLHLVCQCTTSFNVHQIENHSISRTFYSRSKIIECGGSRALSAQVEALSEAWRGQKVQATILVATEAARWAGPLR
jgi:hypothetical protein